MDNVAYARPESIGDACELLQDNEDASVLAGGQSLLPLLRTGAASVQNLVDISGLEDRQYIRHKADQLLIGCVTRYADIVRSELVVEQCPILAEVCDQIGDRQVRNQGTLCGSIAHADPAGDPPVLATILDAEIVATGVEGTTVYQGETFFSGFYETDLGPDEIVTEVRFPTLGAMGAGYRKWESSEGAYPVATAGGLLELEDGTVSTARIGTGGIEGQPLRINTAESYLEGRQPSRDVLVETAVRVGAAIDPLDDHEGSAEFKTELVKTLTVRALGDAAERAGGGVE